MKNATLLILTALIASMNTVNANENTVNANELSANMDDYKTFCTEQAQLAGIEDENELKQYVEECVESYTGPVGE